MLNFKQNRIHLFWVACIFLFIFWLSKGHQEVQAQSKCGWIKGLLGKLHSFGFRNSFCLYKNCIFLLAFLRDFITMDSSHKLASRQQPRYSTIWCFILLLLYVMLSSGNFSLLLKRMHLVLSSPKWLDSLYSFL